MKRVNLEVEPRAETGKGPNRRLRATGRIPAVVYGNTPQTVKVSVNAHDFGKTLAAHASENVLFNILDAAGQGSDEMVAVIRELQRDPVTRRILHIDLHSIRMDAESDFEVPVRAVGSAIGVREGGILETHRHTVAVRCLPLETPSTIEVNITDLKINHAIHASDLTLPEGVKLVDDAETVFFTVVPPKTEVVPTPAEGVEGAEETAQPEVIGKKKEDEEGEADKDKGKEKK
jgi:large subunit ribosomal protein L25